MKTLLLTCSQTTDLLTAFMEDGLAFPRRLQVRAHLALCPGCRAFLHSLRQVPARLKRLLPPEPPPRTSLEGLLRSAMGRIAAGEGAGLRHPAPELYAKPHLAPLLAAHAARCSACAAAHPEPSPAPPSAQDPLGQSLRAQLPPEAQWKRHRFGLGGAGADLVREDASGTLYLLTLPAGKRFPVHTHHGTETAVLLQGELEDQGNHLPEGSLMAYAPGETHAPMALGKDCLVLVHMEGRIRFSGWRRIFG
jgi:predicted ChrR family anti-sigma factor